MSTPDKHTFALHCSTLDTRQSEGSLELVDQALWHRIVHILRLTAGEQIILFDGTREVTLELSEKMFAGKNKVIGVVRDAKVSVPLMPTITLMPSLLKREAFETVIYLAAQMGATTIQPLLATKTQRAWHGDKEHARLMSIMIAACEQAKNFVIPELKNPILLKEINNKAFRLRSDVAMARQVPLKPPSGIYFEDDGTPLMTIANHLVATPPTTLTLIFGPEGGLTTEERQHLNEQGFMCCALTPTILRAQEAVAVGLGCMRSLLIF